MDSSVSPKDENWFLRVCHHISNAVYQIHPLETRTWLEIIIIIIIIIIALFDF